jgi:hypothetical protein
VEAHDVNMRIRKQQDYYVAARRDGMQPEGIGKHHVDEAIAISKATGKPYRADEA